MLILFDQATPVPIRPYLEGHTVLTAAQQGWDSRPRRFLDEFPGASRPLPAKS
jgi:hypothetical protein